MNYYAVTHDLDVAGNAAGPTPNVSLERLTVACDGGGCPALYRTDRGTVVVQGYAFEPAHAGVTMPPGEQMVEIPVELLAAYLPATG